jgi:predicted nicotinamide N-methyase
VTHVQEVLGFKLHLATARLHAASETEAAALGAPEPYWAFIWPGGRALAEFLRAHPELIAERRVLAFGAGAGLEALVALRHGAREVVATEVDPRAVVALAHNAALNALSLTALHADVIGRDDGWDVVLAADVLYGEALAARVVPWLRSLAARGATVLVSDPDRGFLPEGLEPLATTEQPFEGDASLRRAVTVYRLTAR